VIVGACYRDSARELPYSSLPDPKAVRKPLMVWAACEDSPDERGILAAAVRSTDAWRMNGTSVAAPVVARRLFNRMKKQRVRRSRMSETLRELAEEGDGLVRMGKARGVVP
jgi:hypothetical protein